MTDREARRARADDLQAVDYSAKPHRQQERKHVPSLTARCFAPRQLGIWLGLGVLSVLWCLPVRLRDALGSSLGLLHYRLGKSHWRAARRNLRLCFPERSEAEIVALLREHSATQWCVWLDLPALWLQSQARLRARTDYHGLEQLRERASTNQPTVLLVCHNSALEHAAHSLKSMLPMLGYYRRFKSPVLDWLFYRLRSRNGGYLTERQDSLRSLVRDIGDGWQLYQMIDEDLGADLGEFASFFATQLCVVTSTARLCRMAGATACPVFSGYDRRRHRYRVKVLPAVSSFPSGQATQDARAVSEVLETLIREEEVQFMWHQRMLQTRPEGAPSPYLGIRSASD
ncbi:MAG: hypothetical protein AAF499_13270 [Pseudomonadota bacterium]